MKWTRELIGQALKSVYDDVVREPVPSDMLAELDRLPKRGSGVRR